MVKNEAFYRLPPIDFLQKSSKMKLLRKVLEPEGEAVDNNNFGSVNDLPPE